MNTEPALLPAQLAKPDSLACWKVLTPRRQAVCKWLAFVFNDGTMILTNPEQNSTFVGARYIYKFQ